MNGIIAQMQSWHDGGLFMGMHWLWWSVWILTIVALLWAFVRLFSERSETRRHAEAEETAVEVLRRRFADGEIDEEEYARRMKVLRETHLGG